MKYYIYWYRAQFGPIDEETILRKFSQGGTGAGSFVSALIRGEHDPVDAWIPAAQHPKFATAFNAPK